MGLPLSYPQSLKRWLDSADCSHCRMSCQVLCIVGFVQNIELNGTQLSTDAEFHYSPQQTKTVPESHYSEGFQMPLAMQSNMER